jgi:hypothetical protein
MEDTGQSRNEKDEKKDFMQQSCCVDGQCIKLLLRDSGFNQLPKLGDLVVSCSWYCRLWNSWEGSVMVLTLLFLINEIGENCSCIHEDSVLVAREREEVVVICCQHPESSTSRS